jgi:electron transfer flavoprotein beta subunit
MSDLLKILVPVKRAIDYRIKVRVKSDKSDVDLSNVKMAMNPFDEIAVEEAIKLKEQGIASEVVVITVGDSNCQETLRAALALGADRAILVEVNTNIKLYPLQISKIIKQTVEQEQPHLIIMGKQSIDGDNNQTGQMLAALLNWGQGTFASKVECANDKKTLLVTREVDGGLQTIELKLPCLVTTDLRLNKPRYATLPNIMKAKNKPLAINKLTDEQLAVLCKQQPELLEVTPPTVRQAGIMVNSVDELIEKLHKIEKVI